MATIAPFRGIRYNTDKIDDLSSVIAPPYDIVDKQSQDAFYDLNPYNIIRLEFGRSEDSDCPENNRYTRARETFSRWQEQNILLLEKQPVFYLYRQSFSYRGSRCHRTGLIAALKLEPFHTGAVLPHELTLSRPKADRLELFRSCRANFSPIFALLPDPENEMERICAPLLKEPPLFEFPDREGQEHQVWAIASCDRQKALQELVAPRPLLIADGHHRYETALNYSQEMNTGGLGFSHALIVLVSLHSPGLLMLPTHRLLSGLNNQQSKSVLEIAARSFYLEPRGRPENLGKDKFLEELSQKGRSAPSMGMLLADQAYLLTLKPQFSGAGNLDVTLLRDRVIEPLLKGEPEGAAEQVIGYTTDWEEVIGKVTRGDSQVGFILNPTPVEEIVARARQGKKMPQKSTYFFPKLPSGLVIYSLEKSL